MLFNSFQYFIFFTLIWIVYAVSKHRIQNILLLVASYYFYGQWDYRFLALLLTTSSVDYFSALFISSSSSRIQRKALLIFSTTVNLSILGLFKYFNFFIDSLYHLIGMFGLFVPSSTLNIVLPVGISFYTFKSMSYVIDVYRKNTKPAGSYLDYALFVSFFPQLLAGPIERSSQLLKQITKPRTIDLKKLQTGFFYLFWGLFLKVFVADNLSNIVDPIFSAESAQTGFAYLIAGYAYTFQIYGDFAGYSYMAMGSGYLLGFKVMNNFNLPYFAHNPQEFWRRWHISLSTWFRDYLYIPLGGNRSGLGRTTKNLIIVMLLCGLWHGAKITFVLWGGVHGILLSLHLLLKHSKETPSTANMGKNSILHFMKIFFFFHIIVASWYIFRADSINQLQNIFFSLINNFAFDPGGHYIIIKQLLFYTLPLLAIEFFQYYCDDSVPILGFPGPVRGILYVVIFYLIVIFGANDAQNFIYLQF